MARSERRDGRGLRGHPALLQSSPRPSPRAQGRATRTQDGDTGRRQLPIQSRSLSSGASQLCRPPRHWSKPQRHVRIPRLSMPWAFSCRAAGLKSCGNAVLDRTFQPSRGSKIMPAGVLIPPSTLSQAKIGSHTNEQNSQAVVVHCVRGIVGGALNRLLQ